MVSCLPTRGVVSTYSVHFCMRSSTYQLFQYHTAPYTELLKRNNKHQNRKLEQPKRLRIERPCSQNKQKNTLKKPVSQPSQLPTLRINSHLQMFKSVKDNFYIVYEHTF